MNKKANKALSLALSLAIVASMLPMSAMAAGTHWVTATLDGKEVYNESYPDTASVNEAKLVNDLGIGIDVKVTVNNKAFTAARPVNLTGTMDNGTVYRIAENSDRSLSLTTTNKLLNDNINISIERVAKEYKVSANSGFQGFKDNLGSDSNPTCSLSSSGETVNGNSAWTGTFTPNDGQVIKTLNIRTSANSQNIVSVDAGAVTVGSTKLTITRNNGAVTVRASQMADDLYITALTADKATQHQLSVVTVGDVTTSVVSELMDAGSTKSIVLTPGSSGVVDAIEINDGGKTGTLTTSVSSVSVNGHTYKVTRDANGEATVSVPGIAANVTITATASNTKAGLTINMPENVTCNLPAVSYPEKGAAVSVKLEPDDESEITSIKIQSGTDTVVLNSNEYRFFLEGKIYRVDTRYDSSRILYFDSFPGNIKITVESKETRHSIKLDTDKDCDYEGRTDKLTVDDGASKTFSFVSLKNDQDIQRLVFTIDGKKTEVNRNNSYININGTRCPITWEDGRVVVTLYDVTDSMTVKACSTSYDEDYMIKVDHDGGVTTSASRVYANYGNSKTITFTERKGYEIESISVTVKGKTYTAERGDSYLTIDGRRCSLSWTSTKASITLSSIRNDMEVYCDSDYNGLAISRPANCDYIVTLIGDDGVVYDGTGEIGVDSGDSKTVSFAAENGCWLERLVITYKGATYRVSRGTGYVYIDGYRCVVDWNGSTEVSLSLRDIRGDVTVEAVSNYTSTSSSVTTRTITKRAGTHTKITTDPNKSSIKSKDPLTVTVTPDAGYVIDTMEFKLSNTTKSVTLSQSNTEFLLGSQVYTAARSSDGSVSVYFDKLPANLTVTSTAKKQDATTIPPTTSTNPTPTGSVYHVSYIAGTGSGQFSPNRAVTRAEALTMLLRATRNLDALDMTGVIPVPYVDVTEDAWYSNFVTYAYNQGLLFGLHNTTATAFNPNAAITRAEFVEMAERMLGISLTGQPAASQFGDVLAGHWASGVIAYATSQGWIAGYPSGNFGPDDTLTRAQLVVIINRATGRSASQSYLNSVMSSLNRFSDVLSDHWAFYDILEAANSHYCNYVGGVEQWAR